MAKRRRRGRWRWIYSGTDCIGQIEQNDLGHWCVIVDGKLIGTVGDERVAAELVRSCAAGNLERGGRGDGGR